ncbi:RdgB/HAM1 family non-canonical purine NTP pyrophosphatase [Scleromatobacter humisilvae]|uniref:dITP/XTP pyrophosphatase n=1 Tax=Scleromatobacter humisilvae TaxID=2897159 RepID=A0A9X1YQ38_9BURK|nr:RdgB/HAM1 family non-canonical purine NTP pyrophosphatase [Scleromatobacter humisilvae]MCK9689335.1 RdgB/HAM1 family non-canonical purine NTP pyrophosphatase [Scleromatobacter humisilvae]
MKLVLASNNAKKLAELQALFDGLGVELVRQGELGVSEAEEPHVTFIENALAKARHASAATGLPAIADDSGLCVDALGGMPGVISANYATVLARAGVTPEREAERATQDEANNALLLEKLRDVDDRRACFMCTLMAIRSADDPQPLVAMGRWNGEILRAREGEGGFGYDPLMFIPAFGATVASLSKEVKNAHSHRAIAAAQMRQLMQQAWHL